MLVIHNPTAGWRRARRFAQVVSAMKGHGRDFSILPTGARGDAERFAREAKESRVVAVAGGDGTINEAVNGLNGDDRALAIIPLGTANVLAAEIGLGTDARTVAATLAAGHQVRISVGKVGDRRFCMMAGVGFDAHVVAAIPVGLKRVLGKGAYVLMGLRQLLRHRRVLFDVRLDGRPMRAAAVIVANGHFYAGRFVVAPQARLVVPEFQVCLMERAGRWNALRYNLALFTGRLPYLPDVRVLPAREVVIEGPAGEPVQADGDDVGRTPVTIVVDPTPLSVVVPPTRS